MHKIFSEEVCDEHDNDEDNEDEEKNYVKMDLTVKELTRELMV